VTSNFAQAALQALIPDLVEVKDRGIASGAKTGLDALGTVIGLTGAALLLSADEGHAGFIVFVLAVLLLGAAANLLNPRVPPSEDRSADDSPSFSFDTIAAPFRQFFAAKRDFRLAVLTRFLYSLGLFIVLRFLTFYLESRFGIDEPGNDISIHLLVGFVLAAAGAASAGVLSDALGRTTVLRISVIVSAAMLVGLAVAPVFAVAAACGAVLALSSGAFQAANWALLSDTMDQKRGGEYYGLANLATAGAGAVAGAFGPLVDVLQAVSPDATYIALFGVAAAITLASLLSIRSIKEKGRRTAQPAPA
jgi:Na+/melibiose symporter-like transporter